jgi:predicted nucleic acid-binding protein
MNSYVVDASIVVQVLVNDTNTINVKTLLETLEQTDQLYTPDFCLLECGNVVWQRVRRSGLPQSTAEMVVQDLIELPLIIVNSAQLIPRALQIGLAHNLALYDSAYLALAERLHHALITVDVGQSTAARNLGIALKSITDFKPT